MAHSRELHSCGGNSPLPLHPAAPSPAHLLLLPALPKSSNPAPLPVYCSASATFPTGSLHGLCLASRQPPRSGPAVTASSLVLPSSVRAASPQLPPVKTVPTPCPPPTVPAWQALGLACAQPPAGPSGPRLLKLKARLLRHPCHTRPAGLRLPRSLSHYASPTSLFFQSCGRMQRKNSERG